MSKENLAKSKLAKILGGGAPDLTVRAQSEGAPDLTNDSFSTSDDNPKGF